MKISTIALTALISFSTSAFAQVKSVQKDTLPKQKTTKCESPKVSKTKTKSDSVNSLLNTTPKRHSGRYCPGCGMG